MKLKALCSEEIRSLINEMPGYSDLPIILFPSPQKQIDIMGIPYENKNLFYYLESIDMKPRINFICQLFNYCQQIRNNSNIIIIASCTSSYTKSLNEKIEELKCKFLSNETNNESKNNLKAEIDKYDCFSKIIGNFNIKSNNSWLFLAISRFTRSYIDSFSTEKLLWSFCSEYFEEEDLEMISSTVKNESNIELEVEHTNNFPYKISVHINAQVPVTIGEAYFTDCVEVSILHFFYMTQPTKIDLIMKYWDSINSPLKDQIKERIIIIHQSGKFGQKLFHEFLVVYTKKRAINHYHVMMLN